MADTKLKMTRGDTKTYTVAFKDDAGAVFDIVGCTIIFTIKELKDDADPGILQKKYTSFNSPNNGECTIQIDPADTYSLSLKAYWFDIQIKLSTGQVYTVLKGTFTIEYDITRSTE